MANGKLFIGLEESGASAYRNAADFDCLKQLHDRSRKHEWYADGWARIDRTIVTVTILDETAKGVKHTLRIDLFDDRVVVGYDRFHQLVDDLDECDPNTQVFSGVSPVQLADFSADWIESELVKYPWRDNTRCTGEVSGSLGSSFETLIFQIFLPAR